MGPTKIPVELVTARFPDNVMYSEIMMLQPPPRVYYDKTTQTVIGFVKCDSNDG